MLMQQKVWIPTQDDASNIGKLFVAATGGTITTCGNFKFILLQVQALLLLRVQEILWFK